MPYAAAFDDYNPFLGEALPPSFPPGLNSVAQRARLLLHGKTHQDLKTIAKDLHIALVRSTVSGFADAVEKSGKLGDDWSSSTDVEQLQVFLQQRATLEPRLEQRTQIEYLATLALACIGDLWNLQRQAPDSFEDYRYGYATCLFAAVATEAIAVADTLTDAASKAAVIATQARDSKNEVIRRACLKLYDEHFSHIEKYSQAASLIYGRLPQDIRDLFREKTDVKGRKKRIAEWLSTDRPRK